MDGSSFIITTRPATETAGETTTLINTPQPEAAAPDMPKEIGWAVIGSFLVAMGSFMAFFGGSGPSLFMTVISLAYLAAYVTVPVVFFRIQRQSARQTTQQTTWGRFMKEGLVTWTGHVSGREAVLQIMTIPAALITAAVGMGIALQFAR